MDAKEVLLRLATVDLVIPAWQMALYIGIVSVMMLRKRYRVCVVWTYLFIMYWGFYLYGKEFVAAAGDSVLGLSVYSILGMLFVLLTLIVFFQSES